MLSPTVRIRLLIESCYGFVRMLCHISSSNKRVISYAPLKVALAMSIGLLVDYVVHVLLRYYEISGSKRDEKVKEMLRTIGSSVLSGGLSTFLGVLPLAFSTSEVMRTVFVCFVSMVSLGLAHGLILLPVLLSYFGPVES